MPMQQQATWPSRVYLPQGIRTWHRVLLGVCATVYVAGSAVSDVLLASGEGQAPLAFVFAVPQLFILSLFLDAAVRTAYLDGTVMVDRRLYGVRRVDVALAPGVRLVRRRLGGLTFSAFDPPRRKLVRIPLRPLTYRGGAGPHPLLALADAVLSGPPRPEPAAREAWFVAQQLRQLAASGPALRQPARRVEPPRA